MMMELCNNSSIVNNQRNKAMAITYAIVRIDTDEDVTEIGSRIQNLEKEISALTVIDVYGFTRAAADMDEDDSPVLYWP